jgi:hypothetical protein
MQREEALYADTVRKLGWARLIALTGIPSWTLLAVLALYQSLYGGPQPLPELLYPPPLLTHFYDEHADRPGSPMQQFVRAVHDEKYGEVVKILRDENLSQTPAGEFLLTELAMRSGQDVPDKQVVRALQNLHGIDLIAEKNIDQVAYALEYRLYGEAVSAEAQQYVKTKQQWQRYSLLLGIFSLMMTAVGIWVLHCIRQQQIKLDDYIQRKYGIAPKNRQ